MYAQAAILAAKYGKQIAIGLVVLVVILGIYFAVKMHERTVEELAQTKAHAAEMALANEVTSASLEVRKEAEARWKAAAEEYQITLRNHDQARRAAARHEEMIDERIEAGATIDDPEGLERSVNESTAYVIRLLNCSSTAAGCGDGDYREPGPDASDSIPEPSEPGKYAVDGDGTRLLAGSRSDLFLSRRRAVRDERTQPRTASSLHGGSDVADSVLP